MPLVNAKRELSASEDCLSSTARPMINLCASSTDSVNSRYAFVNVVCMERTRLDRSFGSVNLVKCSSQQKRSVWEGFSELRTIKQCVMQMNV